LTEVVRAGNFAVEPPLTASGLNLEASTRPVETGPFAISVLYSIGTHFAKEKHMVTFSVPLHRDGMKVTVWPRVNSRRCCWLSLREARKTGRFEPEVYQLVIRRRSAGMMEHSTRIRFEATAAIGARETRRPRLPLSHQARFDLARMPPMVGPKLERG
jgi:hypothetical protein